MREKQHSDLLKSHIAQTYTTNILNKKALQQADVKRSINFSSLTQFRKQVE